MGAMSISHALMGHLGFFFSFILFVTYLYSTINSAFVFVLKGARTLLDRKHEIVMHKKMLEFSSGKFPQNKSVLGTLQRMENRTGLSSKVSAPKSLQCKTGQRGATEAGE